MQGLKIGAEICAALVHTSNLLAAFISTLTGITVNEWNSLYNSGIIEFHAYSYESMLGSKNVGGFNIFSGEMLLRGSYSRYFSTLNWYNFNFQTTANFKFPF